MLIPDKDIKRKKTLWNNTPHKNEDRRYWREEILKAVGRTSGFSKVPTEILHAKLNRINSKLNVATGVSKCRLTVVHMGKDTLQLLQ